MPSFMSWQVLGVWHTTLHLHGVQRLPSGPSSRLGRVLQAAQRRPGQLPCPAGHAALALAASASRYFLRSHFNRSRDSHSPISAHSLHRCGTDLYPVSFPGEASRPLNFVVEMDRTGSSKHCS